MLRWSLVLAPLLVVACGASAAPPPATPPVTQNAPPAVGAAASAEPVTPPPAHLPTACAEPSAAICTPPGDFVERLCARPMQDATIALFAKQTPFSRLYLRGKVDELEFDEEVLALRFHGPQKGGMVVGSGNGTYDVLRWDGSCSRGVEAEMFATARPANPKSAHLRWHRVGSRLQDALIASSESVKRAHARRGKECQGAMSGDVSRPCELADQALVDAIVQYVRSGGSLPEPDPDDLP